MTHTKAALDSAGYLVVYVDLAWSQVRPDLNGLDTITNGSCWSVPSAKQWWASCNRFWLLV